jgi:hypothetical protein
VSVRSVALVAVCGALVGGIVSGAVVALISRSSHFTYASAGTLNVRAAQHFNVNAEHIRLVDRSGYFEFEHSPGQAATTFSAAVLGTSKQTPIQIGANQTGQDFVPFIVGGTLGQRSDLQQWAPDGKVLAAVDSRGRLRLGNVALSATTVDGTPYLVAATPSGRRYFLRLTPGSPH